MRSYRRFGRVDATFGPYEGPNHTLTPMPGSQMTETTNLQPIADAIARRHGSRSDLDSPQFLQTVIDAFPDSILVVDRDYRVVLANRAARRAAGNRDPVSGCLRCYEVSHNNTRSCDMDEEQCPLRIVTKTKAPTTVVHTHRNAANEETYTEVTAAPIFDASGEVRLIVESCRDISDRKRVARFLEIANRHTEVNPLLEAFTNELRAFTKCGEVGITMVDESGGIPSCVLDGSHRHHPDCDESSCRLTDTCLCLRVIQGETNASLPYCTEGGSVFMDCLKCPVGKMDAVCEKCGYKSFAMVPIRLGTRIIGLIHVADPKPDAVSRRMVKALERVALELGTAIQRVQSEEALRVAHDQLEVRVQRRTADLMRTNQALQEEITQRARLEREIIKISEQEQQRIGQELHDGVGQELTGLSYLATSLLQKLRGKSLAESETAEELARGIPRVLGQLRSMVRGLVPLEIDAEDLKPALDSLLSSVEEQLEIVCRFETDRRARVRHDETAVQVYRIAQEAVANAIRHGKASEITVSLKPKEDQIELTVRDNGVGIQANAQTTNGCGLRIMRHRAQVIGGTLKVHGMDEGGTLVTCEFPQE